KPAEKYGVGRFEGTGYLTASEQWDAENRAEDEAEARKEKEADGKDAPKGTGVVRAGYVQTQEPPAAKPGEKKNGQPPPPVPVPPVPGAPPVGSPLAKENQPVPAQVDASAALAGGAAFLAALRSDQKPYEIKLEQSVELAL